jgi:hypothetical protein
MYVIIGLKMICVAIYEFLFQFCVKIAYYSWTIFPFPKFLRAMVENSTLAKEWIVKLAAVQATMKKSREVKALEKWSRILS